jgi:DNA-binding CsgD family transcriptional regulator
LTPRQREIVRLLGEGRSYKEIADRLRVSFSTVNNHLANLRRRFGVHNTVELLRQAGGMTGPEGNP